MINGCTSVLVAFLPFKGADLISHQQTDCPLAHNRGDSELLKNPENLINPEVLNEAKKEEPSSQNTVDIINKPPSTEVITQVIQETNQEPKNQSTPQKRKRSPKAQSSISLKKRKISQKKSTPVISTKPAAGDLAILADSILFDELRTVALEHEAACNNADTLQKTEQNLLSFADTVLDIDASQQASSNIVSLIDAASAIENTPQECVQFIQVKVLRQTSYNNSRRKFVNPHKLLKNQGNLCGLFARFNVESLMKKLNDQTYESIDLRNKNLLDHFTQELRRVQNFNIVA
jgi:hypothetical protein